MDPLPPCVVGSPDPEWMTREPLELIAQPHLLDHPDEPLSAAARALKYSHAVHAAGYDEIGHRFLAALPVRGTVPLQTLMDARLEQQRQERNRTHEALALAGREQTRLRHRILAFPDSPHAGAVRVQYEIDQMAMTLKCERPVTPGAPPQQDVWTLSLTPVPEFLLPLSGPEDVAVVFSHHVRVELRGARWLPLPVLIRHGRFLRCQDWVSELVEKTGRGELPLFISHRWLTPHDPDPEGVQACLTAWQLVAHVAFAIDLAKRRGLHTPRLMCPQIGLPVGLKGPDLAEAILVNILRPSLDQRAIEALAEEIEVLQPFIDDLGLSGAATDRGLSNLRTLLADRPLFSTLLERLHLWYDRSCLPQTPRTPEEQTDFEAALKHSRAIQILGRTVVLLDQAEDFLARAWCTTEAIAADCLGGSTDLLVGSFRPTASDGTVEHHFQNLLRDRHHLVWRALLDTEVFRVQSPGECMARIGLAATNPADLPFLYDQLLGFPLPAKIHLDDSTVITGVFPLVVFPSSPEVLIPRSRGRALDGPPPDEVQTADTEELRANPIRLAADLANGPVPPFARVTGSPGDARPAAHVAIVAACEGEAVLFAAWALRHWSSLGDLCGARPETLSWVAADVAPVGHLPFAELCAVPVRAAAWIVVAASTRFVNCPVTSAITEPLRHARIPVTLVRIDKHENNAETFSNGSTGQADPDSFAFPLEHLQTPVHAGGLFQWQFPKHLVPTGAESRQ